MEPIQPTQLEQWEAARAVVLRLAQMYAETGYTDVIAAALKFAVKLADERARELKRLGTTKQQGVINK